MRSGSRNGSKKEIGYQTMSKTEKVPSTPDPYAEERKAAEAAAKKIRFSEYVPVPTTRGFPQQYKHNIVEGAEPNDYTIPYDPKSLLTSTWRGFVITEDRHGTRYVPVQMTYEQLQGCWKDEIVAWDTRSSQAERIEREFTADAFTLRRSCWSDETPREKLSRFLAARADGDKAPGHYLSSLIRRMTNATLREVFIEVIEHGYLPSRKTSEADTLVKALLASLTEV